MAILRIIAGENKDQIYPLESEKLILGRDSEDIPILDQGVSRSHAEIFRIGEMYFIRDLGSRNGTFVNDHRIDDQDLLRAGDHIHLGNTELVFEDRFARDHDSRIVRFSDVLENQGSTLSINLGSDEREKVPEHKSTKRDEHQRLQTLYRMSRILGTGEGMEETMYRLAEELSGALNADHVYIFAFENTDEEFRLVAAYDSRPVEDPVVSRTTLRRVRDDMLPVLSSDAMLDDRFSSNQSVVVKRIKSLMCVPLLVMKKTIGALYFTNSKLSEVFSAEDLELATTSGMLVGNALEMWEMLEKQGSLYRGVLKTLSGIAEHRLPGHRGSAHRVATYAAAMARAINLNDHTSGLLWIAGLLHDVGAIALTEEELKNAVNLEQRKAKMAAKILSDLPELKEVGEIVRMHTERIDGSGFPEGLSGDQVPREAQIVGLACRFDELLTHGGEDGGELSVKEALYKISDDADGKFEAPIINSLLIAYRRGILFEEDELIFQKGI
jgi:response regulator RpfG family c-di-GMP phosphodiesterase/pSer/pThr/pTyr-binding forkhead associated (FHA) protein